MSDGVEDVQAIVKDAVVASDSKDTTQEGDNKFQKAISAWRSMFLQS